LVNEREQALGILNVCCSAVAKPLIVRVRRLCVSAGIVETIGSQKIDRDVVAGVSRSEEVPSLLGVANALLVMLQRATVIAGTGVGTTKLVVGDGAIVNRGGREKLQRLMVVVRREIEQTHTLFLRSLGFEGDVKTTECKFTEIIERLAATKNVSSRTQIQALVQPSFRCVEVALSGDLDVRAAKTKGANSLPGPIADGMRDTECLAIGLGARRSVICPLYLAEIMKARGERADGIALTAAALLGSGDQRWAGALAIPLDA
jgi:hypothetical protein